MAKFVTLGEFCVRPEVVMSFERRLKQYHLLSAHEAETLSEEWELVVSLSNEAVHSIPDQHGELFFKLKRAMEAT